MSVSRMKNLIILVLSICAACLLAVAVPNRLSQTHEQRRMLAELKTLYESYGLRIELDELPRSPTLYSVELSESGAQTAAQALLGQKAAQPLAGRDALGWVGSAVTELTLGYLPSENAGTGMRFVPVWRIETDAGSFYVNGITREITPL